jgi:hypothetical protein
LKAYELLDSKSWIEIKEKVLCCRHLQCLDIQPVEALARILKIEAFLKKILAFKSTQSIPYGSGRKISLAYYIFLRQKVA